MHGVTMKLKFKLKLKSFLLEQSLYSLEEFYQVTSTEF